MTNTTPAALLTLVGTMVTIYAKGVLGIDKLEGRLVSVSAHEVVFVPARCKRARVLMSYYAPFWAIVEGVGHPAPDSAWNAPTTSDNGTTTQTGRMRSTDPRWVAEFRQGAGRELKFRAVYADKELTVS